MWNCGLFSVMFVVTLAVNSACGQYNEIKHILSKCNKKDKKFDSCMKVALNNLRPFFKIGIPDARVAPFDPHFATLVEQRRGHYNLNYYLRLTSVYERGWTNSKVTKFKTEWAKNRIIYTQYFPEKFLEGDYDLDAYALGTSLTRVGVWNLTLYDYSQTTTLTRLPPLKNGSRPLDVKVEIDRIGDMQIHVSNILRGINFLENILDAIINASWRPGFVVIRPLINDLVSTAFTKIWTDSFKNFPLEDIFS